MTTRDRDLAGGAVARPAGAGIPRERLRAVILPVVQAAGYELDRLSVARAGRRHLVRVCIDGDDGVSLDAVADVSRLISAALDRDEHDRGQLTPGEYVLEVSSPGVDRPLTQPRHWRRNVGRRVVVSVAGKSVAGQIAAADADGVTLEVAGQPRRLTYAELGPGRIQLDFGRLDEIDDDDLVGFGAGGAAGEEEEDEE
jgi:ribosome maturation factor RimP